MARLSERQWSKIRAAYEVHDVSFGELAKKFKISKSSISRRARKELWNVTETQRLVVRTVNVIKQLDEVKSETQRFEPATQQAVAFEAQRLLKLDGIFIDALELNQRLADELLEAAKEKNVLELSHLDMHSKITNRNKAGATGTPKTQVNVQNNIDNHPADDVIKKLEQRHQP